MHQITFLLVPCRNFVSTISLKFSRGFILNDCDSHLQKRRFVLDAKSERCLMYARDHCAEIFASGKLSLACGTRSHVFIMPSSQCNPMPLPEQTSNNGATTLSSKLTYSIITNQLLLLYTLLYCPCIQSNAHSQTVTVP